MKSFTERLAWAVHSGDVFAVAPALIDLGGTIKTLGGTDICTMMLASGQFMFSCDGSGGYEMNVPLDTNDQFKLQLYADGFAPTIQVFDQFSHVNDVRMARAVECQ